MRLRPHTLFLPVLLALLLALPGCGYNTMQQQEEAVFRAYADLDAALQRRMDLIPNLVETVKAYASHEKETLTAVTEARAKAGQTKLDPSKLGDPAALASFQAAQGELSGALSRLMVIVEKYPDLKANQNFTDLQHQLEGTENRINVARQRYNAEVETFNASIRTFPNSMTNTLFLHLTRKEFFKADAAAQAAPKVKF